MQETRDNHYAKIDRKELNRCRHKSEKKWYVILVILNLIICLGITGFFIHEYKKNQAYLNDMGKETVEYLNDDSAQEPRDLDNAPASMTAFITVLGMIIFLPLVASYTYASFRSMSVRITEKNFPEIYAIVQEFSDKLGLKRVPPMRLSRLNSTLNCMRIW